jgi:diguanylate cyclase (GGDEF)-like protein
MEELIDKISEDTIKELKKSKQPAYPLYYKDVFVSLVKELGILEQINPVLLCIEENISREIIHKTEESLKNLNITSDEIKKESERFLEKIEPIEVEEIKTDIIQFTSYLLKKIDEMQMVIHELENDLQEAYKELLIDPLTKTFNKKALKKDLDTVLKVGKNKDLDLVLVIMDIDDFKKVNKTYGHLVGDFVLKKIIAIVRKLLRKEHSIYRIESDDFVILLNRVELETAKSIINRISSHLKKTKFKYKDKFIDINISFGLTVHKKGDNFDTIIHRLKEALKKAKSSENKIFIYKD